MREERLGAVDHAPEVDIHHFLDVFEGRVFDGSDECHARIVVDLVDLAEVFVNCVGIAQECLALGYVGQRLGLTLLDESSPLKHFMHKFDAVIGVTIIVAGVWFVRSRLKALKGYRDAEKAEAAKSA